MEEDNGIGNVPPGIKFKPYPEELVKLYLRPRLLNKPLPCQVIKELNIYDFHPRDILGNTPAGMHLYFFTPRKMKYPKGTRPARGTNGGYWRSSGKEKSIRDKKGNEIGHEKFLIFYEGSQSNGTRTSWHMLEYTIKEFWFPTDRNKNELGAMAVCDLYLNPTPNQSRNGELQVDEHSSSCACMVPAPSSTQFGCSAISSFRNQLMPSPQDTPHGEMSSPEFGVAAASSSQNQLPPQRMPPPQFDFEGRQPTPSDSETSRQTTQWPLPSHWC